MKPKFLILKVILPLIITIVGGYMLIIITSNINKSKISYFTVLNKTASIIDKDGVKKLVEHPLNESSVYGVHIKNTGRNSLKKISLRLVFKGVSENFEILNVFHRTSPEYEFGKITSIDTDIKNTLLLEYEILNPDDESIVNIDLSGNFENFTIESKAENLDITESRILYGLYNEAFIVTGVPVLIMCAIAISSLLYLKRHEPSKEQWAELSQAIEYYEKAKKKGKIKETA